jgi:hypothetical protein
MHDPMVVAFDIYRPFPRLRTSKARHGRWRWAPPFVNVAGREFYLPTLITVWHVEPNGDDALRGACRGAKHWRWHIHHWSLQFPPLQDLRRRLLTRCEWCGGPSRKRDVVNHAMGWDTPKSPWWRGERGLYHDGCTSVALAHRLCFCDKPLLSQGDYGQCAFCGKHRAWRQVPTIPDRYLASLPVGSRIPAEKVDWLKAEWAKVRAEREATNG